MKTLEQFKTLDYVEQWKYMNSDEFLNSNNDYFKTECVDYFLMNSNKYELSKLYDINANTDVFRINMKLIHFVPVQDLFYYHSLMLGVNKTYEMVDELIDKYTDDLDMIIFLLSNYVEKRYDLSSKIDEIAQNNELCHNIMAGTKLINLKLTEHADMLYKHYKLSNQSSSHMSIYKDNLLFMSIANVYDYILSFNKDIDRCDLNFIYDELLISSNKLLSKLKSKNEKAKIILIGLDEQTLLDKFDQTIQDKHMCSFVIQILLLNNKHDKLQLFIENNLHHLDDIVKFIKIGDISSKVARFNADLFEACMLKHIHVVGL